MTGGFRIGDRVRVNMTGGIDGSRRAERCHGRTGEVVARERKWDQETAYRIKIDGSMWEYWLEEEELVLDEAGRAS